MASHWLCPCQQRSLIFSLLGSAIFSDRESSPILVPQVCLVEASVNFLHTYSFIISMSLQMTFEDGKHCDHKTLSREVLWQCHSRRRGSCVWNRSSLDIVISAQRKSVHFTATVGMVWVTPRGWAIVKVDFVSGFLAAPPRSCNRDVGLRLGELQQNSVQSCVVGVFTSKLLVVRTVVRPSVCMFNSLHILAASWCLSVLQALFTGIWLILCL